MIKKKSPTSKSTSAASKPASMPVKKASSSTPVAASKTSVMTTSSSKKALPAATQSIMPSTPKTKSSPAKKVKAETESVTASSKAKASAKSAKTILPPEVVSRGALQQTFVKQPVRPQNLQLSPFFAKQRQRLLMLKDTFLDSMSGVARGHLRSGCDASAFGMHQADAGSDAYDRDFALSILSQEQNSLYEIDEALKRIDDGTYGICEISNKQISRARLEARPFTRYTVECQAELEKRQHVSGARVPVSSLFGITEEENENEDEDGFIDAKD